VLLVALAIILALAFVPLELILELILGLVLGLILGLIPVSVVVPAPRSGTIIRPPIAPVIISFVPPSSRIVELLSDEPSEVPHLLVQLHEMYGLGRWVGAHGGPIWKDHELFTDGILATE
jgi:hypothetical protein